MNGASGVLSCSSRWVSFAQGLSGRIPDVDQALSPTIPVFSVELKPTSDFASRLQRRHLPTRSAKSRRDFWLHTCSSVKTIEVTSVPNQESPSHSFRLREISPPSGNILCVVAVMRNPRFALILFVFLVFSFAFAVPAEDGQATTYDESETQPYERVSPFAIVVPSLAVRTTRQVPSSLRLTTAVASLFDSARVHDADANQFADSLVSFALLCTLRC